MYSYVLSLEWRYGIGIFQLYRRNMLCTKELLVCHPYKQQVRKWARISKKRPPAGPMLFGKVLTCSVSAKRRNPRPFQKMGGVSFFVKKNVIANYQSSLFQPEEYNVITTPVVSDNTSLTSVCPKNVPVQSPLTLQTIGVGAYCTY